MKYQFEVVDGGPLLRANTVDSGVLIVAERQLMSDRGVDSVVLHTPEAVRELAMYLLMWSEKEQFSLSRVHDLALDFAIKTSGSHAAAARRLKINRTTLVEKLRRRNAGSIAKPLDKGGFGHVDLRNGAEDEGRKE